MLFASQISVDYKIGDSVLILQVNHIHHCFSDSSRHLSWQIHILLRYNDSNSFTYTYCIVLFSCLKEWSNCVFFLFSLCTFLFLAFFCFTFFCFLSFPNIFVGKHHHFISWKSIRKLISRRGILLYGKLSGTHYSRIFFFNGKLYSILLPYSSSYPINSKELLFTGIINRMYFYHFNNSLYSLG